MLTYIYLFALIVGGILLAASIFLGGDADSDADADAGADADADAHVEADGEHGQQGVTTAHGDAHGTLGGLVASFLSLRFWTFFAAFFGLTGFLLQKLSPDTNSLNALALAITMGVVVGQIAAAVFRSLGRTEAGTVASEQDYVGLSARVLVGFDADDVGKVRVTVKGTTVDLLATTDEAQPLRAGEDVLVVQINDTKAMVARVRPPAELEARTEANA